MREPNLTKNFVNIILRSPSKACEQQDETGTGCGNLGREKGERSAIRVLSGAGLKICKRRKKNQRSTGSARKSER